MEMAKTNGNEIKDNHADFSKPFLNLADFSKANFDNVDFGKFDKNKRRKEMSLGELMEKAEQQAIEDYHSLIDDYGWTVEAAKKEILGSTRLNKVKKYINEQ